MPLQGTATLKARLPYTVPVCGTWSIGRFEECSDTGAIIVVTVVVVVVIIIIIIIIIIILRPPAKSLHAENVEEK